MDDRSTAQSPRNDVPTVALHGAYRGGNFGDMLLLGIYGRWIRELVPGCRVVMPFMARGLEGLVESDGRGVRELLRASALVYGGGGYFGEPNTGRGWWAVRNLWRHLPPGVIARLRGLPIAISGVGAGPVSFAPARRVFLSLFRWADAAAVRDVESKDYLVGYGLEPEQVEVTADAALSLTPADVPADAVREAAAMAATVPGPVRVGFNVAHALTHPGVPRLLEELVDWSAGRADVSLVLFLDEGPGRDERYHVLRAAREIQRRLRGPSIVVPYRHPRQVVALIQALDLVITTKLHVGIVAYAMHRPALAFPAHQKTRRFYEQIGAGDRCIPLERLEAGMVRSQLERFVRGELGTTQVPPTVRTAALANRTLLAGFLARALEGPERRFNLAASG